MAQTNRIALLQKAEDAARKGEYNEALGIVSRCLDLYPGFSPARVLKSEILSRTGNPDEAISELREIIAANPENIRARMILTELLIQQKDQKQAMTHLDFLSFMVPENDPVLQDLRRRAEELQSQPIDPEPVQTLEFGVIDDDEGGEEPVGVPDEDVNEDVILEDEVTEVFLESDLAESADKELLSGDESSTELREPEPSFSPVMESDTELEEVAETETRREEIVTVNVPEEKEKTGESEVEIKTLTMARVYERQKMYRESLNILKTLYQNNPTEELADEIQRVSKLADADSLSGEAGRRARVIVRLKNWMEKMTCNLQN